MYTQDVAEASLGSRHAPSLRGVRSVPLAVLDCLSVIALSGYVQEAIGCQSICTDFVGHLPVFAKKNKTPEHDSTLGDKVTKQIREVPTLREYLHT